MKKHAVFILCAVFLSVAVLGGPGWCDGQQQAANAPEQSAPPAYPVAPPAVQAPAAPPEQAAVDSAYGPQKPVEPDSASVFFDIFILRPAGALACAGGLIGAVAGCGISLLVNGRSIVGQTIHAVLTLDAILAGQWAKLGPILSHMMLPAIVLSAVNMAVITRTTRAAMLETLEQDYIRTARAKGLRERSVIYGHAFRNALLPVVTLGGLAYARLLSGAVMTETVFTWPGLGRYAYQAAVSLDFPAITGIALVVAIVYLLVNFVVDLSYAILDPRAVRR